MTALMKTYSIALLPGDGTGPEVSREAVKVVNAAAAKFGFKLDYTEYDFGGDRYLRTGETLPDSAIEEFRKHQSIYLGAIGHPDVKPGILEVGILLRTRFELDQYINLRPVKLYRKEDCPLKDKDPKDVDFVVIRENTGGIYTGVGGAVQKGSNMEVATQVMVYSRPVVDRCLKYAYEYTRRRNRKNMLTLVHKCNVLTHCGDLWVRAHKEMGDRDYPDIKQDYNHVDAATMWFVKQPEWYDVVVTENLFGVITDLAAIVQGGLGVRRRRQHQSRRRLDVRMHGRQRPQVHRQEHHQSHRGHRRRRHDARYPRRSRSGPGRRPRRHRGPQQRQDPVPRRRAHGHGHLRSRRPRRQPCVTAIFTTEYTEKHRAWIGLCDPLCPLWFKAKGDSK